MAIDTKGRLAATVNERYSFEVWNLNPKKVLWKLDDQGTSTTRVAFSPNGKLLGLARQSAAGEPIYEVFSARSGKSVSQFRPAKRNTHAIIFSRDGLLAATVGTGNQIEIWKADTGTLVTSFQIEGYNSR
ncbi:WD40 repeat domain-containing protein [bacterium]|nr:MAG: WD40 repeat domain-containing protein [bacterium]